MPEQSIASYISNLTSLGIMILIALFLFLIIFIISKILIKTGKKNKHPDDLKENKSFSNKVVVLNKDPNIFINLVALSFFFLIFLIFILLSLFFLIFKELISIKLSLVFIIFVLVFMITTSIYVVKSKIFK